MIMIFLYATLYQSGWNDPLIILTGIIAIATIAYVVCTIFLWIATKRAAEASVTAANEGRKSTDLLAALNRPYMGVHRVAFPNPAGQNEIMWGISSEIKNFGTLPALAVEASVEFVLNETILYASAGPFSAEIFPQSEPVVIDATFQFEGSRRDEVLSGAVALVARIHIVYAASNGQRYKHRANAQFERGYPTFSVIDSVTTAL
jgi:hypothetical protein